MIDHNDPAHVYHARRNPSGCDRFYCLHRFRLWYWRWTVHVEGRYRRWFNR